MDIWQYIQPLDIDRCARDFRQAEPFPSLCIDNLLKEDFAHQVATSFPSLAEARNHGRQFSAVNERGKVQVTDAAQFKGGVRTFNELLASEQFRALMTQITGIPELLADDQLIGAGMHLTGPHGFLDVHVDFNYIKERNLHRRLNIITFFNPGWREEYGGALELWNATVSKCYHSFLPIFNRAVIFQTSEISFHGTTAVTCPPDISRKSIAAYYYTNATGPEIDRSSHSTIFRARPKEHWKRWVAMPLEVMSRSVRRGKSRLKSAIKRTIKGG